MKIRDLKRWPKLYAAAMKKLNSEPYPYNELAHVSVLNKVGTPDDKEFWTAVAFGYIDQAKGIYGYLFTEVDVFHTVSWSMREWSGREEVTASDCIDSLGLSILEFEDVAMTVEEEFDIELQDCELGGLVIISDLVQLVEDKLEEKKVVKVCPTTETNLMYDKGVEGGDVSRQFILEVSGKGEVEGIFTLKEYELSVFKRNTREQLNVLASKDMIDGDLLAKFDKLLREV